MSKQHAVAIATIHNIVNECTLRMHVIDLPSHGEMSDDSETQAIMNAILALLQALKQVYVHKISIPPGFISTEHVFVINAVTFDKKACSKTVKRILRLIREQYGLGLSAIPAIAFDRPSKGMISWKISIVSPPPKSEMK